MRVADLKRGSSRRLSTMVESTWEQATTRDDHGEANLCTS